MVAWEALLENQALSQGLEECTESVGAVANQEARMEAWAAQCLWVQERKPEGTRCEHELTCRREGELGDYKDLWEPYQGVESYLGGNGTLLQTFKYWKCVLGRLFQQYFGGG